VIQLRTGQADLERFRFASAPLTETAESPRVPIVDRVTPRPSGRHDSVPSPLRASMPRRGRLVSSWRCGGPAWTRVSERGRVGVAGLGGVVRSVRGGGRAVGRRMRDHRTPLATSVVGASGDGARKRTE
jgi:hypothetical protein